MMFQITCWCFTYLGTNFTNFTQNEVINCVLSLSNSSVGYDNMPASIVKQLINVYVEHLVQLINLFIKGASPYELK